MGKDDLKVGGNKGLSNKNREVGIPLDIGGTRLPAADVHDAGCRHRGGQPVERVASAQPGRTLVEVEREAVEEGHGLGAAAGGASALAHRCFLLECRRDVLLPGQHPGRFQPVQRELAHPGVDDRSGHRYHPPRGEGEVPGSSARIISDNGPQFIVKDFKEFIRISGMTHVRTSPFYPQSNGKIERWHKSLKAECIRPGTPLSLDDARRLVESYVEHYNNVRLNSATGYITPKDMLAGRQQEIHSERDSGVGGGAEAAADSSPASRLTYRYSACASCASFASFRAVDFRAGRR